MFVICKRIEFSCSHRLWDKKLSAKENKRIFKKCSNKPHHGHNYICEIYLESEILKHGMVVNFTDVKKIVKKKLIDKFDHYYLNTLMPKGQLSTAENIAKLFYGEIKKSFPQVQKVRIWETSDSWAEYYETKEEKKCQVKESSKQ